MTYEGDFDERWDGEYGDGEYGDGPYDDDLDARVRELFLAALPEFTVSPGLGDRAMAGAKRRRARARALGVAGAVAVVALGALAVVPLAGWGGGRGPGVADARIDPGAFAASPATATPSPSPSTSAVATPTPTSAPTSAPTPTQTLTLSQSADPVTDPLTDPLTDLEWIHAPKAQAVDRVQNALQSSHQNSFMGVGFSGEDYTSGAFDSTSVYNSSPIVVYRKPNTDPSLEAAAISAASPFKVVFQDTVLDASEQWFLGHRLEQDAGYWKSQGVVFMTALQNNGTITISAPDPGMVVPLLEQHYGYTGQVFVGHAMVFQYAATPPVQSSPGN